MKIISESKDGRRAQIVYKKRTYHCYKDYDGWRAIQSHTGYPYGKNESPENPKYITIGG